ncbi:MAG: hypothetical protein WB660_08810 [Candidatus Sulfotelmatobacter sp.]
MNLLQGGIRSLCIGVSLLTRCFLMLACSPSKAKEEAESAVTKFHSRLDAEQYHDIYVQSSPEFQKSGSEAEITEFLAAVHRKLGRVRRSDERGFNLNFNTSGSTVTLSYNSQFANGTATEQFVWRAGDHPSLINYRIDSPVLVTK